MPSIAPRCALVVAMLTMVLATWTFARASRAGGDLGAEVAEIAKRRVAQHDASGRRDCSGFVMEVLAELGIKRSGGSRHFWQRALREGRTFSPDPRRPPRPGDLAFFDHTYDRNRNGKLDDELTHIAVVVELERGGQVVLAHRGSRGPALFRLHLAQPHVQRRDGEVKNSVLRPSPRDDRRPRLAGELLRGFARPPS